MGLKKQVIQFKDGVEVNRYGSSVEAANHNGTTKDVISKCCNGKQKEHNGYTYSYSGEFTNKIERNVVGEFKCPYCESRFETYNGLTKHILKYNAHPEIKTKEQLLTDYKYGGVRPTCKCGCGEYTDIAYDGGAHFGNYIRGHASRVHNNWGHNENAKIKSAKTRRKQYDSGERVQWNKGKKWEETYDKETIERLSREIYSDERNDKIRDKLKGVPKSEEHAEKCRENGRSEKSIMINREKIRKRLEEGTFSISSEIEKEFIEKCIVPLGLEFSTQYYLNDIRHFCDVYIPSINTIIEFQGDYWHGNPKKYLKEQLSPFQLKKVEKDDELREYCRDNGIGLIEVWESDYRNNSDEVIEHIVEVINNLLM